jgi:GH18 family chitinase
MPDSGHRSTIVRLARPDAPRALLLTAVAASVAVFIAVRSRVDTTFSEATGPSPWSIGYLWPFGNPALPVSEIEWQGLTHLVHYGAVVNADGSLDLSTEEISSKAPALISAGHAAGVKVLLALIQASWTDRTSTFEQAATQHRRSLLRHIADVVERYGYDGVSVDSEPVSAVAVKLLAPDLRAALDGKILIAVASVDQAKIFSPLQDSFDRISIMTYDLTGAGNSYSWHNAALYSSDDSVWSVDLAVKRFVAAGLPAAKLDIGIPFYGWRLTGGGVNGPRQNPESTPALTSFPYFDIISEITPKTYHWDSAAQVPYLSVTAGTKGSEQFVTYDNEQSIAAKVNYVKKNKLGGWIIWHLQADFMPAGTSKHPLLAAVKKAMSGGS